MRESRGVSGTPPPPSCISLERHRDDGHPVERAVRLALVVALVALVAAALANVFGQRQVVLDAASDAATLRVSAPGALRSGLLFQGKFEVEAHAPIGRTTLVLSSGWSDAITVNSIQPQPVRSSSDDGRVTMQFEPLGAGRILTVYLYLQANPTTAGRRDQGVELRDGDRTIAAIERTVTVFP